MRRAPRLRAAAITLLAFAAATQAAGAQAPEVTRAAPFTPRAILLAPPKPGAAPIMVNSPDFANQNYQDKRFFQTLVGGLNMAPGVSWSAGPSSTQSYVLFIEGEGGARIDPTVHWIVYNIPAVATRLPTGIPKEVAIKDPAGAINGREDSSVFRGEVDGEVGYRGPNFTTDGGRPHPYSFEVFALDTKLDLDPAKAKRNAVIAAMQGHVLASGVLVVRFGYDNFKPPQ
ncbi:MAG TPA: YbhB/YbcL family Raf kinase inhibitor-like protein [Xanthobacteraceae bacterium]|jgi:Raf kinase inhibitor-like YbhB/YbcL family protein